MRPWGFISRLTGCAHSLALVPATLASVLGIAPAAQSAQALRIGVPYLPPVSKSIEARLYTEESFELDLAREVGARLARPVELVRLGEEETGAALASGRVALVLTRGATPAGTGLSTGFSSGLAASMRSDTSIRRWEDLAGKTVCISEANEPARKLAEGYGAAVRAERAPARSLMRVRTGECDAAIHDEELLRRLFSRKEWQKFSATLPAAPATELRAVLPAAASPLNDELARAIATLGVPAEWKRREERWVANVAFEVYLEQEAPDCH
ncbi:transporter substrate-binding domain-containing protein [Bosea sp. RCC_152_1]|uniref:hypothetical protein n=1 Tax=Bosea sp. RCC_152_1 TaxID=3239228 RepID=UPI0035256E7C